MKSPIKSLAAIAVLAVSAHQAAAQVVLNVNNWQSSTVTLMTRGVIPWCADVETATQGRVKCNILPKPVVSPGQTFDAVRDGLADVSYIVPGYTPGRFLLTQIAEFPFSGESGEELSAAYQRIHDKHLASADEHKGVLVLAVFTHGPGHIFSVKKPVGTINDLKGMKIRVGGGFVNELAKSMGVNTLLKPATESYELLASGIADGIFFPKNSPDDFKFAPLIKHMTLVPGGLYNTSFTMIANPDKWNRISAADRAAIQNLCGEHLARRLARAYDIGDAVGFKLVQDAKVEVRTASPQLVDEIRQASQPVERAWFDKVKAKGLDGAAILEELRAESKRAGRTTR
jgi:TRAP-type C4-dicarboxylate transport system substrate-binding protein